MTQPTPGLSPVAPGEKAPNSHSGKADRGAAAERQAVADRANDIRQAILNHPDESRPATAGELAATLALIERLAKAGDH